MTHYSRISMSNGRSIIILKYSFYYSIDMCQPFSPTDAYVYLFHDNRCLLTIVLSDRIQNMISYSLLFLLFGFSRIILVETSLEFDRVKERLQASAQQLPITEFPKLPKPATYLNSKLTKNAPHQINLVNELTSILPEWNPRMLALDSTCPYYFSKYNTPENDLNLLSYLQASQS